MAQACSSVMEYVALQNVVHSMKWRMGKVLIQEDGRWSGLSELGLTRLERNFG
jgi:hypothetical protein